MKTFLIFLALVVGLSVVLGLLGLALGWFNAATEIISPANVKRQWKKAYDLYESMEKGARQVCDAETVLAQSDGKAGEQRVSQVMAYKQVYYGAQRQYNAAMDNFFEAGFVKPPDLPRRAPELEEMMARVCK